MDANFGGPVWHASLAYHGNLRSHDPSRHIEKVYRSLSGAGDPSLGEWLEQGPYPARPSFHLRRRLTLAEWGDRPWGFDLRRTEEGDRRLAAAGCPRSLAIDEYTEILR